MYYSITKRIVKAAFGFIILIAAFAFAFFIIHFNNETESFDDIFRSFLKVSLFSKHCLHILLTLSDVFDTKTRCL